LASLGAAIETFALEIRHLQRTEVGEVAEPFRTGEQKGSSAMPHKRNPVKCEQLCGLARVLRGYVTPALEDVALWHERDISHSSVERIVFPDAFQLAYYMTVRFRAIAAGMTVDADRMRANIDSLRGLVFSQPVLLALVESGMARDDAYRAVQRNAVATSEQQHTFAEVLADDPEVAAALSSERLAAAFSLDTALEHASRSVDRL
jgi:adenylosuccinate lyase